MDEGSAPGAPSGGDAPAPRDANQHRDPQALRIDALERELAAVRAELHQARVHEAQLGNAFLARVRNNLAALRSIFSRTVAGGTDLSDVADHVRGRMDAIGRYQLGAGDFTRKGFDLDAVVRDELIVFVTDQPRIDIGGPPVRLDERAAEAFALAVHELATNSIKFGVLGYLGAGGSLSVRWTVRDRRLTFVWHERGVAVLAPAPMRYGFGREFIEQGLPYQIGATTSYALAPGEVRCVVEVDLKQANTSPTNDANMDLIRASGD